MTALDASFDLRDHAPAHALFYASSAVTVLDHFRVPYEVKPELSGELEQLRPLQGGPRLLWKRDLDGSVVHTTLLGADRVMPIPLFTRLLSDDMIEPLLQADGGSWKRVWRLMSLDGAPVASVWRREDGSVFLPFDPNEVVESFWAERYSGHGRRTAHA